MTLTQTISTYPFTIDELLTEATKCNASDLHLVVKLPPFFRINGEMIPSKFPVLEQCDIQNLILNIITEEQKKELLENWELDFSYSVPKVARYRGNVILQRGTFATVFRVVPFEIPKVDDLGLPTDIKRLCQLNRGLILVTGPTGSGKSTTL
ncbi:MAG: ATPase, T2SS/T4P/T4SS family, partial [Oscillospiraceae bacterium]